MTDKTKEKRRKRAEELFEAGYNCAQAVALAFSDLLDIPEETLAKTMSSFGGGMGRLREVCGAVSGSFAVAGLLYGFALPNGVEEKHAHYDRVQKLAAAFREKNGSIICRELLGVPGAEDPKPEARTPAYYKKRPCKELVGIAAENLAEFIAENPVR